MCIGEDSDIVSANFICGITVGGNPIGTNNNTLDFALFHNLRCHIVTDKGHIYSGLHQLPSGETCAL